MGAVWHLIGILDFTFHNLRHTFSRLLQSESGVGAVVLQGITDHSRLCMRQKHPHTGLDSLRTVIDTLTAHVLVINESAITTWYLKQVRHKYDTGKAMCLYVANISRLKNIL